ncbi:hypothetical protein D3C72_2503810 [compost metagenome]
MGFLLSITLASSSPTTLSMVRWRGIVLGIATPVRVISRMLLRKGSFLKVSLSATAWLAGRWPVRAHS